MVEVGECVTPGISMLVYWIFSRSSVFRMIQKMLNVNQCLVGRNSVFCVRFYRMVGAFEVHAVRIEIYGGESDRTLRRPHVGALQFPLFPYSSAAGNMHVYLCEDAFSSYSGAENWAFHPHIYRGGAVDDMGGLVGDTRWQRKAVMVYVKMAGSTAIQVPLTTLATAAAGEIAEFIVDREIY
ncbi:hypothetical protein SAY87_008331 [Trapa incisa]|uniref:Uncharacterized protein n=1 Tax=Trapa incisa TaxID=236973 RepID=A0AAN7KFW4_9MYRT|nr:hypothetical protein SAY87_008331 [Trapa incisa]